MCDKTCCNCGVTSDFFGVIIRSADRSTRSVILLSWFCNSYVIKPLIHISASAPLPCDRHCIEVSPQKCGLHRCVETRSVRGGVEAFAGIRRRRCRGCCKYSLFYSVVPLARCLRFCSVYRQP